MNGSGREACLAALDVSRETAARLDALVGLLGRWTAAINLVAPATLPSVWTRHILDSGQLFRLAPVGARRWADLGAGAGFPGLVIAALAADRPDGPRVALIESDARKCAFMAEAARVMGVTVDIRRRRLEGPPTPDRHDVVSARALAPLPRLLALAEPWLAPSGVCLFLKGAGHAAELTEAARDWHSVALTTPSLADPAGVVLSLSEVRRAPARG